MSHTISATRRIQFCAGHRVYEHEGKCKHLHGHNYVALVTAQAPAQDDIGRVIDFSVLKEKIGGWIDQHWDHGFILYVDDLEAVDKVGGDGQKLFLLPENPTAENMAKHLLYTVGPAMLKGTGVALSEVILWETENCYASVAR